MTDLYLPPEFGEWTKVTDDIAVAGPDHSPTNEHRLWIAHRGPDGKNHGIGRIVFGPGHHTLVSEDPLHVEPSILFPVCCGLHGFIRDGKWVSA